MLVAGQSITIRTSFSSLVGNAGSTLEIYCNNLVSIGGSTTVTVYNLNSTWDRISNLGSKAFTLTPNFAGTMTKIVFSNVENWFSTSVF